MRINCPHFYMWTWVQLKHDSFHHICRGKKCVCVCACVRLTNVLRFVISEQVQTHYIASSWSSSSWSSSIIITFQYFFLKAWFAVLRWFNFSIVGNFCFVSHLREPQPLHVSVIWDFGTLTAFSAHWRRWSSVVVVNGLRNEWPRNGGSIPGKGKRSVCSPKLPDRPSVPPIFLLSGLQGLFVGGKAAWAWSWLVP